jgi:hypothetical protein
MATIAEHREISVRAAILLHPENGMLVANKLWQNLADILTPLIGRHDLECLFSRSLHLNKIQFPEVVLGNTLVRSQRACSDFQAYRRDHGIEERNLAYIGLLDRFIDTLILLVGEGLTEQILNLAWRERRISQSCTVQHPTS